MKYYFVFIIGFCCTLYSSCNRYSRTKPTEFFRIEQSRDNVSTFEAFVVYNAPVDTLLLLKMVENYNVRTLPVDVLKRPYYKEFTRAFYKNSEFLTRDFESGARDTNPRSPYTYQELNAFVDDQIMTVRYSRRNDGSYHYSYRFKRNFAGEQTTIIHDLDSFYHAKRLETADVDTTMVR